jgi:2-succinyl-5-enolpyruvyl-6-hydroxy-3-cyclohexene-1-carboxylate synthase
LVAQYDAFLRHAPTARALSPKLVLRFGGGLTSKVLGEWVDGADAPLVLFSEDGSPFDPAHRAVTLVRGNGTLSARALTAQLSDSSRPPGEWASSFAKAQEVAASVLARAFEAQPELTEPLVAHETARALPDGARLFVASSMPIRDLDAFALPRRWGGRVLSNRGLNGIDGTLSTSVGVAATSGRPTVVLTGDLAFLHDLNGLLIARRHDLSLTVVLVNNDGGGIFSFLPVAQVERHFEELFGTPHGMDFAHAAALFGARYVDVRSPKELRAALGQHVGTGLSILDVRVDRHMNPKNHQALYAQVQKALEELPWR